MRQRTSGWVVVFAVGLTAMSSASHAQQQQPKRLPTVGILFNGTPDQESERTEAFREGLQAVGYVEGQNILVEYRFAHRLQQIPEMVSDLVARNVDVIATSGALAIAAAKRATSAIPVVMIACDRAEHLVASIARPGGNVTGMTCISSDLAAKRLQLLQEIVPALSRVAVLYNPRVSTKAEEVQAIRAAAHTMGLTVLPVEVRAPEEFEPAFSMAAENAQALIGLLDPLTIAHCARIVELAAQHRLPGIYGLREFAEAGGLLSFGTSLPGLYRRYAVFIDKILKGAKAGDIPIEEPTTFELVVNLRYAAALGLTVPPTILARADEVIE